METMVISCPECDTRMKVPESAIGKKVRCKKCENVFPVKVPKKAPVQVEDDEEEAPKPAKTKAVKKEPPKPAAKPPKPEPKKEAETIPLARDDGDDVDDDGRAYGMTHEDEGFRCPQCAAEMEGPEAIVCLNCGFNTRSRTQVRTRKIKHHTGSDKFLWLLPGILAVLGILSLIGYWCFHHFALPDLLIDDWEKILATHNDDRRKALGDEAVPWTGILVSSGFELWLAVGFAFLAFGLGTFAVKRLILHPDPPEVEIN